ncbi:MAG TPA: hypothetical protein DCP31_26410 [Cyanobacteria bacterium UBA8543]|nr:hypothetical protein [Cyanobacteria bacterium UBA8543]
MKRKPKGDCCFFNKQQTTNNKQPTTNNKQQTTNNQQPTLLERRLLNESISFFVIVLFGNRMLLPHRF